MKLELMGDVIVYLYAVSVCLPIVVIDLIFLLYPRLPFFILDSNIRTKAKGKFQNFGYFGVCRISLEVICRKLTTDVTRFIQSGGSFF